MSKRFFYLMCLFFLLSTVSYFWRIQFFNFMQNSCSRIVLPVVQFARKVTDPFTQVHNWVNNRKQLINQLEDLRIRYDQCLNDYVMLEQQARFIDETEELIAFRKRYYPENKLLARVLSRAVSMQNSQIMLDKGSEHGVILDHSVVYKNCLLGRISQVFPTSSLVTLISDHQSRVAAEAVNTKSHGILEGAGGLQSHLNFVSHLQKIEEGELLISSGQGTVFPRGFALGRVKRVSQGELYHIIEIEPLIDITQVNYCYILDPKTV